MEPLASRLLGRLAEIEASADELLREHSEIERWTQPGDVTGRAFAWEDLDPGGRRTRRALLAKLDRYLELARAVLQGAPASETGDFELAREEVWDLIEQSSRTYYENLGDARQGLKEQIAELRRPIQNLMEEDPGPPVLVPDTNVLVDHPSLEDWVFDGVPEFEIVLLPTVLTELDDLKRKRDGPVGQNADAVIRRIKGYRDRGRITDGVPLRTGRSTLRAVPVEPESRPLPWLQWQTPDDRILGTILVLARSTPNRPVALVTRDLNLQNKAEFAEVPFLEPPEDGG